MSSSNKSATAGPSSLVGVYEDVDELPTPRERPSFVRADSVTDLLDRLHAKQAQVKASRKEATKRLGELKETFKKLKKDTDDLLKTQNHNITTIGRKL